MTRVLAVFEPGRSGETVLRHVRELAPEGEVTVAAVAPCTTARARCGTSALDYNAAVCEMAADELDEARTRLGDRARSVAFELLTEALPRYVAREQYALVLLPSRGGPLRRAPHHPDARALRRRTSAEVRILAGGSTAAAGAGAG